MGLFGNSADMRHRSEKALSRRVIGLTALSSLKPYVERTGLPPKLLPTEGKSRKYHPHNSAADTFFLSRAGGVRGEEGIRRHARLERQSPIGGVEPPTPSKIRTKLLKRSSPSPGVLSSSKSGERTASSAGQTRGNRRAPLVFPAALPSREERGREREREEERKPERERGSQREGVGSATSAGGRGRERERDRESVQRRAQIDSRWC